MLEKRVASVAPTPALPLFEGEDALRGVAAVPSTS